jgi:hypothetical protein
MIPHLPSKQPYCSLHDLHNSSPIALQSAGFAWYQIRSGDEREGQSNDKKSLIAAF